MGHDGIMCQREDHDASHLPCCHWLTLISLVLQKECVMCFTSQPLFKLACHGSILYGICVLLSN